MGLLLLRRASGSPSDMRVSGSPSDMRVSGSISDSTTCECVLEQDTEPQIPDVPSVFKCVLMVYAPDSESPCKVVTATSA